MLTQKQMQDISKVLEVLNDCGSGNPVYINGTPRISVEDTSSSYSDRKFIGNIEYDSYKGLVYKKD